ncbi:MAG: M6 family metalloprotease domain-containing protein, partial [Bacteroidales bacterium]
CYAIPLKDTIVESEYVTGEISPKSLNLKPYINISQQKILEKRKSFYPNIYEKKFVHKNNNVKVSNNGINTSSKDTAILNNIVIYIRFSDQTEFPANQTTYSSMFNETTGEVNSLRNYFNEVSYNKLDISSTFYPTNNGTTIISYQDIHIRDYYIKYSSTNDSGFTKYSELIYREHSLLKRAITFVKSQIDSTLNFDYDNDGNVDNVCFIIRGGISTWSSILWPHKWALYSSDEYINGKKVFNYNLHIEDILTYEGVGVLAHEMFHTIGAEDLYHYNNDGNQPVGNWDIMENAKNPPQHMSTYMKAKYGGWITSVPVINSTGTYILNPITASSNNCYKLLLKGTTHYLLLEYRKKYGTFENSIPQSGLIIYRINPNIDGNAYGAGPGGASDEVYAFRLNGSLTIEGEINEAYFSDKIGRQVFTNTSNPFGFQYNGNFCNIFIKNIYEINNTISFDVRFCDNDNIVYSNTNNLPVLTNVSNSITTFNTVSVKNTDNVIFEAANEITLNPDFEVQQGGDFEMSIFGCILK